MGDTEAVDLLRSMKIPCARHRYLPSPLRLAGADYILFRPHSKPQTSGEWPPTARYFWVFEWGCC
jgi:hypothetical protein